MSFPSFIDSTATEIVFYDLETTIPPTDVIEFGAVVVNKTGKAVFESYFNQKDFMK